MGRYRGFAGATRRGPLTGVPELITSVGEFERVFGGIGKRTGCETRQLLELGPLDRKRTTQLVNKLHVQKNTGTPIAAAQDPAGSSGVSPTYVTPSLGFQTWDSRDYNTNGLADDAERMKALCELNVLEQAYNVCQTTVLHDAWARGQTVVVHGWVYGLHNGLLQDLKMTARNAAEIYPAYETALAGLRERHAGP